MLFVLIALWLITLILWLTDTGSSVNRWLGAVALSGGAGALAAVLDLDFIPYIHASHPSDGLENALYGVQAGSSLLSYYGLPYCFLLFAFAYVQLGRSARTLRYAQGVLLLPIIGCLLFTPGYNSDTPITHEVVVWWAVPYFIAGALIVLLKKSRSYSLASTHWLICLSVLPPVLFAMVMNYVLPSLGLKRMWVYNVWFVGIGVAVFFIGLFTYGFLGIRVLVDRRRLDSTLRAVTSGTAILHHAIKNDVGKVRLFTDKIKSYAEETNQPELLADIRIVQNASLHIQDMISRVHRRTEDLVVKPREASLDELIFETLKPYEPLLGPIELHLNVATGWRATVDPAQVGEALNNLISNAIDAMNGQGHLFVSLKDNKRELTIEVRDTGPGMDSVEAAKALEPFYTTKGGKEASFGLGLPYAYYVMRKHGGSLRIRSKRGVGTRVYMIFNKSAVKAVKPLTEEIATAGVRGIERDGQNQRMDR
jgi:signal transduction histidine kinase